jgi:hypothetical protein
VARLRPMTAAIVHGCDLDPGDPPPIRLFNARRKSGSGPGRRSMGGRVPAPIPRSHAARDPAVIGSPRSIPVCGQRTLLPELVVEDDAGRVPRNRAVAVEPLQSSHVRRSYLGVVVSQTV